MTVITLFIGHCGAFRAKMKILARLPTRVIVQTFLFSQIKALQSDNRVYVLSRLFFVYYGKNITHN